MSDDDEHRARRLRDSSALQAIVRDLSRVPPARRMLHVHEALIHAIDRSIEQHSGHRFKEPEIEIIKDVAYQIVYILDPKNRQASGLLRRIWDEFAAFSAIGKIAAIATVLAFIGGAANGAIEFTGKSYELWKKITSPPPPAVVAPPAPPPASIPTAPAPKR